MSAQPGTQVDEAIAAAHKARPLKPVEQLAYGTLHGQVYAAHSALCLASHAVHTLWMERIASGVTAVDDTRPLQQALTEEVGHISALCKRVSAWIVEQRTRPVYQETFPDPFEDALTAHKYGKRSRRDPDAEITPGAPESEWSWNAAHADKDWP